MARLLAIFALAILFTASAACSPKTEKGEHGAGENARTKATHREATDAPVRATTGEGEATTPDATATWDYVALGDSLAAGVGAHEGYVDRYAGHLRADAGARVRVTNLGVSGQTSTQLLHSLRHDPGMRKALGGAEVVTLNIGLNDLGEASGSYETGTCGGPQNEACLREAVDSVEENWDAIIEEISSLRSTEDTVIRTVGLGYTPRVGKIFEPYVHEVTRHIATSATDVGIPYVEVRLGDESISEDGLHPNDNGYRLIADRLAKLGYEPLYPRCTNRSRWQ